MFSSWQLHIILKSNQIHTDNDSNLTIKFVDLASKYVGLSRKNGKNNVRDRSSSPYL